MTIFQNIQNGGFETGNLNPWVTSNTTVVSTFSHTGFFSARQSATTSAILAQTVNAFPGVNFELDVSLSKVDVGVPSPPVGIFLAYYNAAGTLLGNGLVIQIPPARLPDVSGNNWYNIHAVSSIAPAGTAFGILLIGTVGTAASSDVLVDDVSLIAIG